MSALGMVRGAAIAATLFLMLPVASGGADTGDLKYWSLVQKQVDDAARTSCYKIPWAPDAGQRFEEFVSGALRTLRKDSATDDDVRKAIAALRAFCTALDHRVKEEEADPEKRKIVLDDFLAQKRTSVYPFEREVIGEAEKLAFELAFNFANGLIVLTTGILALTITFRKDLVGASKGRSELWLKLSWATYLLSIIGGIIGWMAIIGPLNPLSYENPPSFLFGGSIRGPALFQLILFVVATAFLVLYGVGAWTTPRRR